MTALSCLLDSFRAAALSERKKDVYFAVSGISPNRSTLVAN